jgi:hypothetical protein
VLLHVCDRPANQVGIIVKRTHRRITEEADDPAHVTGLVIVIDLFGFSLAANGAQTALSPNELIDLCGADTVPLYQVVVTGTAPVVASQGLATLPGVTRFAVSVETRLGASVSRELSREFGLFAFHAPEGGGFGGIFWHVSIPSLPPPCFADLDVRTKTRFALFSAFLDK